MEHLNRPDQGANPTNRPGSCNPFTVEFTTNTDLHKMGEQQYIESTEVKIGRSRESDISFGEDCKTVSRNHAKIKCVGGKYILEHLSESNPTYVNGKNVGTMYPLSHRDTIQFSDSGPKILFLAPGAIGSNSPEDNVEQKTVRGNATTVEQTQRFAAGTNLGASSSKGMSCLPFIIEFQQKSQLNYPGQRITISDPEVIIGRAPHAMIRFADDCSEISTEHAVIRCKDGQWYLEHKSKTNPTYVNEQNVFGEVVLTHDSIIHFASLHGQSIRFYLSGAQANTGRVQHPKTSPFGVGTSPAPQPSLSTRLGEMISKTSRTQKLISLGLAVGLILALGFISWTWIKTSEFKKEQEVYKEEQMEKDRQRKAQEDLKYLEDHFPEDELEPFVFFADGKLTLETDREVVLPLTLTGSSFLTNTGRLITARHVIRTFDYPENCLEAISAQLFYENNVAGYKLSTSITFSSPQLQKIVHRADFRLAVDKPQYPATRPGCLNAKTCSTIQDWAVAKPLNLSKVKSKIEVDPEFSLKIEPGTRLIILGYRDSKSQDPQIKEANLSLKEPMPDDNSNIELYKINNPSFGPGDSGAPVFAFSETKKKWVVVGIVLGREGDLETTRWGVILPIAAIDQNLLE